MVDHKHKYKKCHHVQRHYPITFNKHSGNTSDWIGHRRGGVIKSAHAQTLSMAGCIAGPREMAIALARIHRAVDLSWLTVTIANHCLKQWPLSFGRESRNMNRAILKNYFTLRFPEVGYHSVESTRTNVVTFLFLLLYLIWPRQPSCVKAQRSVV